MLRTPTLSCFAPWLAPWLALAATATLAAAQPAATEPRVGVVVELTVNVTPERTDALGGALADALRRELEVEAIGGGDVTRRLPDGGVPDECVATPACIADLARRLDATELLFLAVVQVGDDIQIDSSWVDVAGGEIVARPRIELHADARAGEVFSAAATRLLPHAHKRPLATVFVAPEPTPAGPTRHLTTGTWIAAGVATAALAGGTGLGLSARSSYHRCERDECSAATKDAIGARARYADLLFGAALAGTATAVVLYLRSARAPEAAATAAAATAWTVTPTRGGAVAEVRVGF